jgi:hypothetical protein
MDVDLTVKSLNKVLEHIDFVNEINPVGGEIFIYKKIDSLLINLTESIYFNKVGRITIITNCTMLPKESTLRILQKHSDKFIILLSDYKMRSRKRFELVQLLNKYEIAYRSVVYDTWYKTSQPMTIPDNDINNTQIKCSKCECRIVKTLRIVENKVFTCPFVPFAMECKTIPYDRRNYLDVSTDEITKYTLEEFEKNIHPGMAYCSSPFNQDKINNILIPVSEKAIYPVECKRYDYLNL